MLFSAESPRAGVDDVDLSLYRDDQGFVCLDVTIGEGPERTLRIGQPTAKSLGQAMVNLATEADTP